MKAWLLDAQTGLSALRIADVPDPVPGPGEVLLKVHLASLNPADRYLAEAAYPAKPTFPHILGRDAVGTVLSVGDGVSSAKPGDVRAILRGEAGVSKPGTFAEKTVVPADVLVPVPGGWSEQQAAGAPLVYLTAYQALTQFPDLPKSGVALVTGASGGVGVASLQLASALGLTPVALSRDAGKSPALTANGAALVLNPSDPDWKKQLYAKFGSRPTVIAIDNIAGPLFPQVVDTLAQNGRMSLVGRLAGPVPEFNTGTLFFRRVQVRGVAVGTYSAPEAQTAWFALITLLAKTGHKPLIDQTFEFGDLLNAFDRLKSGPLGKVLLKVG